VTNVDNSNIVWRPPSPSSIRPPTRRGPASMTPAGPGSTRAPRHPPRSPHGRLDDRPGAALVMRPVRGRSSHQSRRRSRGHLASRCPIRRGIAWVSELNVPVRSSPTAVTLFGQDGVAEPPPHPGRRGLPEPLRHAGGAGQLADMASRGKALGLKVAPSAGPQRWASTSPPTSSSHATRYHPGAETPT